MKTMTRSLVRPQTCQCRCLRLHPLGRLPAGARPSVCHLERDEPAFTLLLSAWLTMTVIHSVAAPARLRWAARSLCPHTPLKRTDCLKPHLRPLLLLSPAHPRQNNPLLLQLPLAHCHKTGKVRNPRQTVPPPPTSCLLHPGHPLSSLQLSRRPLSPPPHPLYFLLWRSLSKGTQLTPWLLGKSQDLPPEPPHPPPPPRTRQ